jgi:hypothetical protein
MRLDITRGRPWCVSSGPRPTGWETLVLLQDVSPSLHVVVLERQREVSDRTTEGGLERCGPVVGWFSCGCCVWCQCHESTETPSAHVQTKHGAVCSDLSLSVEINKSRLESWKFGEYSDRRLMEYYYANPSSNAGTSPSKSRAFGSTKWRRDV